MTPVTDDRTAADSSGTFIPILILLLFIFHFYFGVQSLVSWPLPKTMFILKTCATLYLWTRLRRNLLRPFRPQSYACNRPRVPRVQKRNWPIYCRADGTFRLKKKNTFAPYLTSQRVSLAWAGDRACTSFPLKNNGQDAERTSPVAVSIGFRLRSLVIRPLRRCLCRFKTKSAGDFILCVFFVFKNRSLKMIIE